MKPVAIIGNYPNANIPFDEDVDIWAINALGTLHPRIDMLFQIHRKEKAWHEEEGFYEWMKENKTIPICMREKFEEIPMCVQYPFEEVYTLIPNVRQGSEKLEELEYLTSTPAMAVALAIYQEREKILVYGIEMDVKEAYFFQRDCFTFWLGIAGGRGIEIEIHYADAIFKQPVYG